MSAKQTANGHNHALYDCFRVSPPEDSETAASKAGLLAHASSYSEAFPYGKQRKPSIRTVAISFRPHWQLRGQLRIPTGFPIKPFRHLAASWWICRIWTFFILKQGLTFDNYEFMVADGRLSAALSPRRLSFLHHVSRGIQHPFIVFNARNLSRHITHHQQRVR